MSTAVLKGCLVSLAFLPLSKADEDQVATPYVVVTSGTGGCSVPLTPSECSAVGNNHYGGYEGAWNHSTDGSAYIPPGCYVPLGCGEPETPCEANFNTDTSSEASCGHEHVDDGKTYTYPCLCKEGGAAIVSPPTESDAPCCNIPFKLLFGQHSSQVPCRICGPLVLD